MRIRNAPDALVGALCSVGLVLGLAGLASCAAPPPAEPVAPLQSPNDRFAYRLLTLDNGLKALLISNPDTPKAAASMDVRVGSGDNPRGRAGLAHFLEHMLFLGTEKYPDAAEYERFITEHGGSRNAYTSFEHTNYFFDIDPAHLPGALDRFAQFFIAPNMDARYVERERNAVEAEYQMGLKSDTRRGFDALQASMNPAHPFSRFTVGSLETLADRDDGKVRDELLAFYDKHYSANLMRLVVLGREPLDELESTVAALFSAVPDKGTPLEVFEEPLFADAQLPMLIKVKPLGTQRQLQVNFQIPEYRSRYRARPMAYVSNLVGHEGAGSLLSALKREGLADALSSGELLHWRGGALFSVNVSLTERGVAEHERVLQQVFAYLDMLRETGPREWLYAEQSSLARLAFRFREPTSPIDYVSGLSNDMHYYADEDILQGPYLMARFEAELIADALALLTPDRAQVVLTAPEVSTDRVSPFYSVPFARLGPEQIMLRRWQSGERAALRLPAPNPFIAEDVAVLPVAPDNGAQPQLRLEQARKRIWYRQAEEFRVPRGALYVSFRSPLAGATAEQSAAAALYAGMVTDAANERTYPALLAGLGFSFYDYAQGLALRINGYNDKQLLLLRELLTDIGQRPFDAARFERIRREMVLSLQNTVARRPSSQLMDHLRRAVNSEEYDEAALIAALQDMSLEKLAAYRQAFWASARSEALIYGNYPAQSVEALAAALDIVLTEGDGAPVLAPEVLALKAGAAVQLEAAIEHDDAVVAWYLQGGRSWRQRAEVALTAQIVQSGFFQQLRTEQQLGYVVSSFAWPQYDVPALMLFVQSPSHSAAAVYTAMRRFLDDTLETITAAQYARHRQALVNDILKPDENLLERAESYWQSIATRDWTFDEMQRMAETVSRITFEEWQRAYRQTFLDQRRSLPAVSPGARRDRPVQDGETFTDPAALRAAHPLHTIDLAPL